MLTQTSKSFPPNSCWSATSVPQLAQAYSSPRPRLLLSRQNQNQPQKTRKPLCSALGSTATNFQVYPKIWKSSSLSYRATAIHRGIHLKSAIALATTSPLYTLFNLQNTRPQGRFAQHHLFPRHLPVKRVFSHSSGEGFHVPCPIARICSPDGKTISTIPSYSLAGNSGQHGKVINSIESQLEVYWGYCKSCWSTQYRLWAWHNSFSCPSLYGPRNHLLPISSKATVQILTLPRLSLEFDTSRTWANSGMSSAWRFPPKCLPAEAWFFKVLELQGCTPAQLCWSIFNALWRLRPRHMAAQLIACLWENLQMQRASDC